MLMKTTTLALLLALSAPAVAHADAPAGPTPKPFAPAPSGAPTLIRIVPLQGTSVFIQDAEGVVGRFTETGMMTIPSGRTFQLSAMRGATALWVGRITTDGREISVVWSGALEPKISVATPAAPPPPPPPPPIVVSTRPTPMKSPAFEALIVSIHRESFDNQRVDLVRVAAARDHFSVAQVSRILDSIAFEANRLTALEVVRNRITDPENAYVLPQRFTFANNRRRAAEILGQNPPPNPPPKPPPKF
jgi:hypothetical protein